MKIAIFGDKHFAARNASKIFNDYFLKSFREFYLPHMKENGISRILQLGDLFDVRKHTSNLILKEIKENYFDVIRSEGFKYDTLAGNHDLYWKESLDVVTQDLVLREYENITVFKRPSTIIIDNTSIDIIPWICSENEEEVMEFVKKSNSDICAGHFEFSNFSMYRGQLAKEGMDHKLFQKYEMVWSGHFHTRSSRDNVTYLGTPHEITLQDAGDPKGYYIFDTVDRSFTFYENPYTIFSKIEWNDDVKFDYNYDSFTGKYVRLLVSSRNNSAAYEAFLQKLYASNPLEVKILEDMSEFSESRLDEEINLEDTESIINNYIDNLDTDVDREKLKNYHRMLYTEAVNIEV